MAGPKLFDRVKDTTTTTGTGTVTLANSAPTGFRTFGSVLSNADTTLYAIVGQGTGEWETGLGTYTSSGTTLARTTVFESSNSNAAVSFSSGTKDVFIAPLAQLANRYQNPTDTFANLVAFQAGRIGWPTDGIAIYRDSGSAFSAWGPIFPLTPFVDSGFTWRNQGSSTITVAKGLALFTIPGSATSNVRAYTKSKTAPYTMTIGFVANLIAANTSFAAGGLAGLCFFDGTKYHSFAIELLQNNTISPIVSVGRKWTNSTTLSAVYQYRSYIGVFSPIVFLRIADDSTNRICSLSADGQNWTAIHTIGRTDFLTATDAGLFFDDGNANLGQNISIIHFAET